MEDEKKPNRSKKQVAFQLPPHVAEWIESQEFRTGGSRGRLGIMAFLALELSSVHVREMLPTLASGIDLGYITFDDAVAFFQVHDPAIMEPGIPRVKYDIGGDYWTEKLAIFMSDVWDNVGPFRSGQSNADRIAWLREDERKFATERRELAEERIKARVAAKLEAAKNAVGLAGSQKPKRERRRRAGGDG